MTDASEAPLAAGFWQAVRRSLLLVLAVTLLGGVAGAVATFVLPKSYQARTELILLPTNGKTSMELNNSTGVAKSMVSSYASAVTSTAVLTEAIARTKSTQTVADLAENITMTVPSGTVVIDIDVTADTAQGAADLANAIGDEFVKQAPDLMPRLDSGTVIMEPFILRPAVAPTSASSLGLRALVPVGAFIGAALGLAIALLRRRL